MNCIAPKCGRKPTAGAVLCATHMKAPIGQRGGWVSAHRRKLKVAQMLDVSNISPRLWMGGAPPFDKDLPAVDILVLCARELQPTTLAFHGEVLRCPLIDDYLEPTDLKLALDTAHTVATQIVAGKRVLVTCAQGRNRSGLVTGLALGKITLMSHDQIIALIRRRRGIPGVFSNEAFTGYLKRFIGAGRQR